MERIERALEVARLHRLRMASQDAAAPVLVAPPAPTPIAPPPPKFGAVFADDHDALRLSDAAPVELPSRETLRERCVVFPDEPGAATLAYKMLRTQVLQRARQHSMRCIGVISAASGEGKTVTAVNLAMSLAAEPNQSVVLVDLDLKRPSIAATLGLDVTAGLENHLVGDASLSSCCRRLAPVDRLFVAPTLAPVAGSSELLASSATAGLVKSLREAVEEPLVLFDLPPALLSDDVLAIAPLLDGVVLVVTEELTRREDLQRVFDLLRNTPVIGTVLNASSEAEARAY